MQPRKTFKDLQKAWRITSQDHLKNMIEGRLKTFLHGLNLKKWTNDFYYGIIGFQIFN